MAKYSSTIINNGTLHGEKQKQPGLFTRASATVVVSLFMLVLALLTTCALISTSMIKFTLGGSGNEHTFFVRDNPLLLLLFLFVFFVLSYIFTQTQFFTLLQVKLSDDHFFSRCKKVILAMLSLLSCIWIAATIAIPGADQRLVQEVVVLAQRGDWSLFAPNKYMGAYPHQQGFFWISMVFATLFGKYTSAFIQVFNVGGIVLACSSLGKITEHIGASRFQQLATMTLCILYFPLIQYVTFVYGLIWGLGLSLFAIQLEMDYFETGRIRYAIFSSICIGLAILFKNNYEVFFIGMVLYAVSEIISTRQIKQAAILLLLMLSFVLTAFVPPALTEYTSGYEQTQGMSSWSWIAMGLQDGPRAPGWFNEYNRSTFAESGYDTKIQENIAKMNINQSIRDFGTGKRNAFQFFLQKTASQWNNPTFQASWIMQVSRAAFPVHDFTAVFLSAKNTDALVAWYLNPLHCLILFASLLWVLFTPWQVSRFYKKLALALIMLGGFLCHTFWEAKCQYVLPYFVLLFPYAVIGLGTFTQKVKTLILKTNQIPKTSPAPLAILIASCLIIATLFINAGIESLTFETDEYAAWVATDPPCSYINEEPFLREALDFAQ